MTLREFLNRICIIGAEMLVEETEERVRDQWRSFGPLWTGKPQ